MKSIHISKLFAAIAASALLAVGCGKSSEPKSSDDTPPPPMKLSDFPGLTNSDPMVVVETLNNMYETYDQTQTEPFTGIEDFVKCGMITEVPKPPAGRTFVFDKEQGTFSIR